MTQTATAALQRVALLAALLLVSMGARYRSANYIVETPDANFAQQMGQAAEKYRHDLAIEWLGQAMPNWAQPCVMTVKVGPHLGAGGATTFMFDHGEVFGWRMLIQGSTERLLDSVLPHEITHMIYASHFRRPLPRWADEGGATSVEHASEKNRHRSMLNQFLRTGRGIAFNQMFAMTEYPQDIMPLYAQGYSLAEYLIQTGGRRKYIEFLSDGLNGDDWPGAIQRHYGIRDLGALQTTWLAWVQQGMPSLRSREGQPSASGEMLAANDRRPRPEPNLIYHVRDRQSPSTASTDLVPVHVPAGYPGTMPAVANAAPTRAPVTAAKWTDPSRVTAQPPTAMADSRVRPNAFSASSGWRATGAPPLIVDPVPTQVTHPQPLEQARQTILE